MQYISIQIAPEFLAQFDRHDFLARARAVGRTPEIDEFVEKGEHYLQFHFFTEAPKILWQDLQKALYNHPEYRHVICPISIAVYDDENASDLLTLHHFDRNEKIDQLK